MKLSEMRELLDRCGIQLTKSLGQNFLHDPHQLKRIVAAADLTRADKVLEIGPGLGPLTALLLPKAGQVLAIEKDARLVEILRERFNPLTRPEATLSPIGGEGRVRGRLGDAKSAVVAKSGEGKLELLHADALRFLQREKRDWRDWKLVANLPYSVASPILVELACGDRAPKKIAATLQLEVARRLMAKSGEEDYGVLTLLVQLDFEPRDFFKIPPGCFFPEPDVASACVVLDRRELPLLPQHLRAAFVKIVKRAFSQRRKMMLKLLKADWPKEKVTRAFAELRIPPQERAEKLGLERFVEMTKMLA